MNALAKHDAGQVIQADSASLMGVISRAASDPKTDVDKLERLLGMYQQITAQQAKQAYTAALATMQPLLPVIDERGSISIDKGKTSQSTYAKWPDINDAIRPLLAEHGFALSFRISRVEGAVSITGVLSHRDGHGEDTTLDLPVDSSGSKNAVQAVGSSVSYGKRYTAIALLNITSRAPQDRDDNGDGAGQSAAVTAAISAINLCETLDDLKAWKANNGPGLAAFPTDEGDEIVRLFNQRFKALKERAER